MENFTMLIIPPKFMETMKQWPVTKAPRIGSQYFCRRHRVVPGDLLIPWISGLGLKVQIYDMTG